MAKQNKRRKKRLKEARSLVAKNYVSGTILVEAIVAIAENEDSEYWDNLAEHAEAMIGYVEDKDGLSLRKMFNSINDWTGYSVGVKELKEKLGELTGEENAPYVEILKKAIIAYGVDNVKKM